MREVRDGGGVREQRVAGGLVRVRGAARHVRDAVARRGYVMPPQRAGYDAQVFYWARSSELASGLDAHLGEAVHAWLRDSWPWWPRVAYPGRDISWDDWEALPEL